MSFEDRTYGERSTRARVAAIVTLADRDGGLRRARFLTEELLPVEHHRVSGLDATEGLCVGGNFVAGRVDESARDPHVAGRQVVVALYLHRRVREQRVVPVPRRTEHRFGEVLLEAPAVLLEPGEVRRRE